MTIRGHSKLIIVILTVSTIASFSAGFSGSETFEAVDKVSTSNALVVLNHAKPISELKVNSYTQSTHICFPIFSKNSFG